jgi:RHS repeat-associated protein
MPTILKAIVKLAKGETTHYVFQGTEPILEKNITIGKMKSFVYALGKHLARVDGAIGDPEAKKYWYITDHLGSVRAVTDVDGKKVWSTDYLAFGTQFGKSAETDFEELHSFTGKELDPDTGLHYYNARWYDSELGRFVSEDPVGDPNNPNLYAYCRNNRVPRQGSHS